MIIRILLLILIALILWGSVGHSATPLCPEPLITVDDMLVYPAGLTRLQQSTVTAAKIQCSFRYRRSPCVSMIRFYIKRKHTNVICTQQLEP